MKFKGKTFVVTGGAAGIGMETVRLLSAEGATVIAGDRDVVNGNRVVDEACGEGKEALFIEVDLEDGTSIDEFTRSATEFRSSIDGLVNCAGGGGISTPFLDDTPDNWSRFVQINLLGTMRVTHGLLPAIIDSGEGRIVNIASEAGRTGMPGLSAYAAAKAGIIALTHTWAQEFAKFNLTVNCIAPGPIDTGLMRSAMPQSALERMISTIPLARVGTPREVAAAIGFFLDHDSAYTTGQTIGVSGGLVMG